ncbi:MAG: histidinol-phosphatase [Calditrichia bacterium]|nr:histidinol-phosphatase [Calditrichia bacterium]
MKLNFDTEIVGCIHIHSTYSDGTESIPQITQYAKEAGLDYLMFSDHRSLKAFKDGNQRWNDDTLVLIGYEINDADDNNHYLAFDLAEEVNRHLPAMSYVQEVHKKGGFGIIAHPDEKRDLLVEHPPFPWTAWESEHYTGIELWNGLSEWMEGLTHINMLYRFIHPRKCLKTPMPETLKRWDEVNKKRKVVGTGGIDAHAHRHKIFGIIPVRIFHYKVQFKTIRTHIMLDIPWKTGGEVEKYKNSIYNSIKETRCFFSNYRLGDAKGFRFWAEGSDKIIEMGETSSYDGEIKLNVHLPEKALVKLVKNGEYISEKTGQNVEFSEKSPGVFRVEVFKNKNAWIFSNHIRFD